jgi:hypothetical protein
MSCTALVKLAQLGTSQLGVAADVAKHLQNEWLLLGLPTAPLVQNAEQQTLAIYFPDLVDDPVAAYAAALRAVLDARRDAHKENGIGRDGWDPLNSVEGIRPDQIVYDKTCTSFPGGAIGLFAHRVRTAGSGVQTTDDGSRSEPARTVVPTVVRTPTALGQKTEDTVTPEVIRLDEFSDASSRGAETLLEEVVDAPVRRRRVVEAVDEQDQTRRARERDARESQIPVDEAEAKLSKDAAPPKPRAKVQKGDSYLAKLTKYIPAEITGLFLVLGSVYQPWRFGDAVICWILTPFYFWATSRGLALVRRPRVYVYLLSFCAFPFWALAVDSSLGNSLPYGVTIARGQATTMMMFAAIVIPAIDTVLDHFWWRRAP